MGICCCVQTKTVRSRQQLKEFVAKKIPVFWVTGPPNCGKTTIAQMLANCSNYKLLKVNQLLKEEEAKGELRGRTILEYTRNKKDVPDNIVMDLLRTTLILTHHHSIGYIIDGFPVNLRQAKLFEKEICKVSLIIYVTLVLDAVLSRMITQYGEIDVESGRLKHIQCTKDGDAICRKYEQKVIKLHANYPPEDTCMRLVENLEDFWGYKFQHLYNKN